MSASDLLAIIRDGGGLGLLSVFVYLVVTGKLVAGKYHSNCVPLDRYIELKNDRDDWKEIAMTGTHAAENALEQISRRRRQLHLS